MRLGCIADDFTGATDLANNLVRAGMRCVLTNGVLSNGVLSNGVPELNRASDRFDTADTDAIVVALKSRTIAASDAIAQSLAALAWLKERGAQQIYFKICSTFDSTDQGNIGPVTEALMDAVGSDFAIACPAFPENKRTIFKGYLFAGDGLLNESGMQNHPLTPMSDANLVRVLQRQSRRKVGLIDYSVVARGAAAIRQRVAQLRTDGYGLAIVDAISNDDLMQLGQALADMPIVTAGSGVAIGLPQNFGLAPSAQAALLPASPGRRAIVSGSCSLATLAQVAAYRNGGEPSFQIDAADLLDGHAGDGKRSAHSEQQRIQALVSKALAWYHGQPQHSAPLFYSSAAADQVRSVQQQLGVAKAGYLIEQVLANIALALVRSGVRQLLVAGGETSGAVVQTLAVQQLRIGPQIDPGVPWCATQIEASAGQWLQLALKSGNFGSTDFFQKAWSVKTLTVYS